MAAPKTVLTFPLDGSRKDFDIPFEYLARKFVVVTLVGATRRVLTANSDYRFATKRTVTTAKAWGPGDLFTNIEIRRVTSATERLVDFSDGSVLRAYDLNTAQVQSLHIAEEARDLTADTIAVNNDGDLDARGRKIVNVADGVLDGDAVSMGQNRRWAESALNQANRSEQQANSATEQNRQATINNQQSGTNNNQSAQNAATASDQAEWAKRRAQYPTNNPIPNTLGEYSALHWSVWSHTYSDRAMESATKAEANNQQSLTNNQQSWQNVLSARGEADRSKSEADRSKIEADKLGNANAFMGTILGVNGMDTSFRGTHLIKQALYIQRQGTDDARDFMSISVEPNRVMYVRDWRGDPMTSLDGAGNYAAHGTISADGGSVFTVAPGEGNAHFWLSGPTGTRGVIYSGPDKAIRIRGGEGPYQLVVEGSGRVSGMTMLALPDATIPANADIQASWMTGGSLSQALGRVTPGTRLRNTPAIIWERGVDVTGGTGDQGAPGSTMWLREPLMAGDFYMFEIYGAAKFYSTTNCIPYGDSATEEHNVQFDSGGAMLFTLTEGGRRISVRAGKPNNQYGIRRVFLFKLTIA